MGEDVVHHAVGQYDARQDIKVKLQSCALFYQFFILGIMALASSSVKLLKGCRRTVGGQQHITSESPISSSATCFGFPFLQLISEIVKAIIAV